VSLGLGSVIAAAYSAAPWIASVGRHKTGVFLGVGALLAFNYWIAIARPRRQACPPGEVCHIDSPATRVNRWLFWVSVLIYVISVAVTYGALWWIERQS
jgi:mercuric ion transport protein